MRVIAGQKKLTRIENEGLLYRIAEICGDERIFAEIKFQQGRARQAGINGMHSEDLVLILLDRIAKLQCGDFKSVVHEKIISHLNEILELLRSREEPCDIDELKIKLYGEQREN